MSITVASKLGLGTASFGLDYGIANKSGKVPRNEVFKILAYCKKVGIDLLDTAYAYGDSESVIGAWTQEKGAAFEIVSKLPLMDSFDSKHVAAMLHQSLKRLCSESIYGYLIHRFEDFQKHKRLWNAFETLKQKKLVKKVGCSFYKPQELQIMLDRNLPIDIVQVPYNLFDRRFESLFQVLKAKKIEIHARSVFLQGLVFLDPDRDLTGNLVKARPRLKATQVLAASMNIPVGALCLCFVMLSPYIDRVIIGVNGLDQLANNVDYLRLMERVEQGCHQLDALPIEDENVLLPYNWNS